MAAQQQQLSDSTPRRPLTVRSGHLAHSLPVDQNGVAVNLRLPSFLEHGHHPSDEQAVLLKALFNLNVQRGVGAS